MRILCLTRPTRSLSIIIINLFKNKKNDIQFQNDLKIIHDKESILKEINDIGFSSNIDIPKELLNEIISYAKNAIFKEQIGDNSFSIDYLNPINPSNSLWYGNHEIMNDCNALQKIIFNKDILNICEEYFGSKPRLIGSHCWWSFPPDDIEIHHQYGFHYDIDSFKFLKIFIYLNNVDIETGPHEILIGTHKKKSFKEKLNRRLSDAAVKDSDKYDNSVCKTGPKGTMFFEDTFSYHKGNTPKKPRLMLQIEYTI